MNAVRVETFCVDATNLIRVCYGHAGPAFRAQEDADAERLVEALDRLVESAAGRVEVELIFDGGDRPLRRSTCGARLRFSRERSADDLILDAVRVRRQGGGGRVTVVTADGDLGARVEAEGGRWLAPRRGAGIESVLAAMGRRAR